MSLPAIAGDYFFASLGLTSEATGPELSLLSRLFGLPLWAFFLART